MLRSLICAQDCLWFCLDGMYSYRKQIQQVGQQVKVYVSHVMAHSGRLKALLHPVYRLPEVDPQGVPYPTYELSELKTGRWLGGRKRLTCRPHLTTGATLWLLLAWL